MGGSGASSLNYMFSAFSCGQHSTRQLQLSKMQTSGSAGDKLRGALESDRGRVVVCCRFLQDPNSCQVVEGRCELRGILINKRRSWSPLGVGAVGDESSEVYGSGRFDSQKFERVFAKFMSVILNTVKNFPLERMDYFFFVIFFKQCSFTFWVFAKTS